MPNILERKKEIKLLIASNNVSEAIKRSMDYVEDFGNDNDMVNEIVLISSNYHDYLRKSRMDEIELDELTRQRNKILRQMLGLLDEVETTFALTAILIKN